jgi:hypothetical protein
MPLTDEKLLGTEKDGSKSEEYCTYCYQKGEYTAKNITMEKTIDICVPHMVAAGFTEEKAIETLRETLPNLKRWKK